MKHICLNPLCSSELPVNKKSPGQKYCNKKCWSDHRSYMNHIKYPPRSLKCNNIKCSNWFENTHKNQFKTYCSKKCSTSVSNKVAPKRKSYTTNDITINAVSIYFGIDKKDVTDDHIVYFTESVFNMRLIYKMTFGEIRSKYKLPHSIIPILSQSYKMTNTKQKSSITSKNKLEKKERPYTYKCMVCSTPVVGRKYCNNHPMADVKSPFRFKFNLFDYPDLFDLDYIRSVGFFSNRNSKTRKSNPYGLSRDHKVSINDAIKFHYDPYYISHIMNCEVITQKANSSKGPKSSLSYDELVRLVDEYDNQQRDVN